MSLIEKKSAPFPFNETYYVNKENNEEYRRIVGGIAWPAGGKPGYAVLLGEDREKDETLKKFHIRLVKEYETQNPTDLLKRCNEFRRIMGVEVWYGDTNKASMMEFLRQLNIPLFIRDAPFYDDENAFDFYIDLIRESTPTSPGKKFLHFGKSSKLPGYLMEAPEKRVPLQKAQEYPAILALGYALAAIVHYVPDWEQEQEAREADALLDDFQDEM